MSATELAAWLTGIWDDQEARESGQTYIEFHGVEQMNHRGNPHTLARIAADRQILDRCLKVQ